MHNCISLHDHNWLVEAKIKHNVWFYEFISLSRFRSPHVRWTIKDEITSGVPTCPESSQFSCGSLTPSCCDLWVYMFCCWWCDSCYLTNVVILLFWQYSINQWKIHQFLQFFIMKLNIRQVFTTLYNKMKDSPIFYNII